ncbi:MAG: sugar transferase [Gemmataceae bacterium]
MKTYCQPMNATDITYETVRNKVRTIPVLLRQHWYVHCKAIIDFTVASMLVLVLSPLFLVIALLIKATSKGPIIYSQCRLGKNGAVFTMYKFRTMIDNCESLTGPRWSLPGDPRITFVGHYLRLSHLDELPQLFNVIKGEMSLIGPRPERPEIVQDLERDIPDYRSRLLVRPGISGLAQVQLPADTDLESVREKLKYDIYYINNFSLFLDARVAFYTLFRLFNLPYHFARFIQL